MKYACLYLYGMFLGFASSLPGMLWNFASEAMVAAPIWLIWNYIPIGPKVEYLQVFGVFYVVGVLVRSHTHHLKPMTPALVYRIETLNGRQYMFAVDPEMFKRDASIHNTILKSATGRKKDVKDAVGG